MKAQYITQLPKTLFVIGISATLTVFGSAEAPGQEKCKMSWVVPAANTEYTVQHTSKSATCPAIWSGSSKCTVPFPTTPSRTARG